MKKLKYLESKGSQHFYQVKNAVIVVDRIIASLYSCERSGNTALCWFIKSGDSVAPVELWKDIKGADSWQSLLDSTGKPEIELLINPVAGASDFKNHPIIKSLAGIARSWGKSVPSGKLAGPLNLFALQQSLEYLEFQNQIDWLFYSATAKHKELIKRGDIERAEVAALCQGIVFLAGQLESDTDFSSSFGVAVNTSRRRRHIPRARDKESYRVGGRTYRPRN
ncbi:hypothetical protein N836_13680 [Leptolyngbya sp. Heron Island J]|uniref:hypothetical protein n=1 Tax=Leptolyngbya sp. Heron Island J TaxID=1385935 RepID=UPI0003B9791B|nr:hypothetical protein [Leptolyngbya sp. Heron Island J]ESA35110.1 hypothetical protein N836_13680 [Leptolyngbya sp. Heron Island J]